jgi:hypothetical protein
MATLGSRATVTGTADYVGPNQAVLDGTEETATVVRGQP